MPIFAYRALTYAGEPRRGEEAAETLEQLRDILASRDLILKNATAARERAARFGARVPLRQLASFNRQFVVLLRAGIPIPEALATLGSRPHQPRLERALRLVLEDVNRGAGLSEAARKVPGAFEGAYLAMIETGERAGALPECLERYQSFMELRLKIGAQVSRAMVYPAVLLATLAAVLVFLFIAVIPNFVSMDQDLGSALPWPTQVLIATSEQFPAIALSVAGTVAGAFVLDRLWASRPGGRVSRDRFLGGLPLIGPLRRAQAAAESARILATLIQSGAPLSQALSVAATGVSDGYVGDALARVNERVRNGEQLSAGLEAFAIFPPESLKMLTAGERGGSLGPMLAEIAAYHETELEQSLARLLGLAEPALILIAGLVVGGVIVAMYLPIFSLTDIIR